MRNLFNFIAKNIHWLLFLFLVTVSVFMIVYNNEFQRSKYVAVENEVVGSVYATVNKVTSYLKLKKINDDIMTYSLGLENRIQNLENQIRLMQDSVLAVDLIEKAKTDSSYYDFVLARVINNSISKIENYLTLNKGSAAGVVPDMAVFSSTGAVGVVLSVSEHYAIVIPLLNPKSRLSAKVKNSNYYGTLVWDGQNAQYTYLEELPRHATFEIGDTVVTSGFSQIFPEGVPVGIIESAEMEQHADYNKLKLNLLTDFGALNEVILVNSKYYREQKKLEEEAK